MLEKKDFQVIGELLDKKLEDRFKVQGELLDKKLEDRFKVQGELLDKKLEDRFKVQGELLDKKLEDRFKVQGELLDKKLEDRFKVQGELLDKKLEDRFKVQGEKFDKKVEEKFDEMVSTVNNGFTEMQKEFDGLKGELEEIKKQVELRPTTERIFSWADGRLLDLELRADRHDYLHINELDKLPPQPEISRLLVEKGFKKMK